MGEEWYKNVLSQSKNIKVNGVLAPLFKLFLLLIGATVSISVSSIWAELAWLVIVVASMTGITFLVYISAFVWLMVKDRNALRSEEYTLKDKIVQTIGDNSNALSPDAIKALSQISTNPSNPIIPIQGQSFGSKPINDDNSKIIE
jgi:hypothetical protein